MFKFSTSISIGDDTIKEIDIETRTMFPHMCIRLESGPRIYIYATAEQLQQIAQAITTWSETQHLPAVEGAGMPDETRL